MPRLVPDQRSYRVTGHRRGHFRTFRLELVNLAPDNFKNGCVVQKLQPSLVGRISKIWSLESGIEPCRAVWLSRIVESKDLGNTSH